jgi:hypothetical protein
MVGFGTCLNTEVQMRMFLGPVGFRTAQNFGCVGHEEGQCSNKLYPDEESTKIIAEYMGVELEKVPALKVV